MKLHCSLYQGISVLWMEKVEIVVLCHVPECSIVEVELIYFDSTKRGNSFTYSQVSFNLNGGTQTQSLPSGTRPLSYTKLG